MNKLLLPVVLSAAAIISFAQGAAADNAIFLDKSAYTVAENGAAVNVVVRVSRDNTPAQTISVDYRTQDGSATSPADYSSTSGTLSFGPNEAAKLVSIPI